MLGGFAEPGLWQSGGFAPEYQVIIHPELGLTVTNAPALFYEPEHRLWRHLVSEGCPIRPAVIAHVLPVVHASALERAVVEPEAEGVHQV